MDCCQSEAKEWLIFKCFFFLWRVFNPGKLHHYGLDFKSINDSELVFTYQSAVYAGRPKGPPDEHYVQGVQVSILQK
jgi:hypothetical protein